MEPLFPNSIWAFNAPEQEETYMQFKIKWVMPQDKSKLFWKITSPDDPDFLVYATKLEFEVPSKADYNHLYCKGLIHLDEDKIAHFHCNNAEA